MTFIKYMQDYVDGQNNNKIFEELKLFFMYLLNGAYYYNNKNFHTVKVYKEKIAKTGIKSVDDIFAEIKIGGKKGLLSLDMKSNCTAVETGFNNKGGKLNHLEMLKYIKDVSIKNGGQKEWKDNLYSLKAYILSTQKQSVVEYFLDDLLKIFEEKADKNYLFQKILNMLIEDKNLIVYFINNKKTVLPILKYAINNHDGHSRAIVEAALKQLSSDDDYKNIIPKVSDTHILFQEENKILKSEIWVLDFSSLVRTLKLKTTADKHVLAYNNLLYSFVNVLKDYGCQIYVLQKYSGNKKKTPFTISLAIEDVKFLKYPAVQDFLDFLSLKIGNGHSALSDMRNMTQLEVQHRNIAVDKIMNIELEHFILESTIPQSENKNEKLKIQKQ